MKADKKHFRVAETEGYWEKFYMLTKIKDIDEYMYYGVTVITAHN